MAETDDDADGGFSLIDEQGRLFGVVNVVDVLVVLLVVAVVVAGAALLLSESGEPDTRHATIDLGPQSGFVAEQITPGDEFSPEGTDDALTITDVYRYGTEEGTNVVVRATVNGTVTEPDDPDAAPVFEFRGEPLRLGQTLSIQTPDYELEGEVTRVQESGETLPVETSEFILGATVDADTAAEIEAGDEFQIAGETIAEISALETFPRGDEQFVLIGISARTIQQSGSQFFGTSRLSVGATIPFEGDGYEIDGTVLERGTTQIQRTDASVVARTAVSSSTADSLAVGDEYRLNGETVATIESLELYPADDDQRYVLLGLDLKATERGNTVEFAGEPLRVESSIPFQTDAYSLSVTILEKDTTEITTEERPFVLEATVPDDVAADVQSGDEYRLAGTTIVSVESVTEYATTDPDIRRLILGVSAATLEDDGTILFGDRQLRVGSTLPIQTSEYDISGEITRRGTLEEGGTPATRTITLGIDNVRPERADVIETGLIEQTRGMTTAEVTDTVSEPAEVVLESEDGDIFLREHPVNKDLELEIEMTVRELDDGTVRFRGQPLRTGQTLTLDFGDVQIQGDVFTIEH